MHQHNPIVGKFQPWHFSVKKQLNFLRTMNRGCHRNPQEEPRQQMENYNTSKKLMTKSEKALGISRDLHCRQPKRRVRDDETRWNSTKTMSNSKVKVTNQKFRSKKHSTCVRIQLIDVVNRNLNQKISIKAKSPDGILQNYVKAPK